MKQFLTKSLYFVIPILVLVYPLDIFISKNLRQSNEYYGELEVWNDIHGGNINADILIYGSSRAWVDINPFILEKSFGKDIYNLGLDGHNFWLQYLRHLEYLKHNNAPKHIIVAVDFNTLQKRKDLYLYEQFLPFMLWNTTIKYYTSSYEGFDFFDYYLPLLRYVGNSSLLKKSIGMAVENKNMPPFRIKGYLGVHKTWTNELAAAKSKMDQYTIAIDSASVALFDAFLLECKNNNIGVSLVYTPEHIQGQQFVKNRAEVIQLFQNFAAKYDVQFLDYSNDALCQDTSNFYNATHLNHTGSQLFTKKLGQDLKLNF